MRKTLIVILLLLVCAGGCDILAYPVYLLFGDHNPKVKAEYEGLADKRIALMIAGQPGIEFEYPYITANLATVSENLISQQVKDTSFVEKEKVETFQRQSSRWIGLNMDEIKNHFDAQQLISIELVRLTLLEDNTVNLLRGRLIADVKVYDLEAIPNDQPVYETDIQIVVPESAPVYQSDAAQQQIEQKLIALFATRLAYKFYDHKEARK